jgi:hypothetical protein
VVFFYFPYTYIPALSNADFYTWDICWCFLKLAELVGFCPLENNKRIFGQLPPPNPRPPPNWSMRIVSLFSTLLRLKFPIFETFQHYSMNLKKKHSSAKVCMMFLNEIYYHSLLIGLLQILISWNRSDIQRSKSQLDFFIFIFIIN